MNQRMTRARWRPKPTKRGEMNKTEQKYAECLEALKLSGEISAWFYEPSSWRLSEKYQSKRSKTMYTPDFMVLKNDGTIRFVDAKGSGGIEQATLVRIKWFANTYRCFEVVIATYNKGDWTEEVL